MWKFWSLAFYIIPKLSVIFVNTNSQSTPFFFIKIQKYNKKSSYNKFYFYPISVIVIIIIIIVIVIITYTVLLMFKSIF